MKPRAAGSAGSTAPKSPVGEEVGYAGTPSKLERLVIAFALCAAQRRIDELEAAWRRAARERGAP